MQTGTCMTLSTPCLEAASGGARMLWRRHCCLLCMILERSTEGCQPGAVTAAKLHATAKLGQTFIYPYTFIPYLPRMQASLCRSSSGVGGRRCCGSCGWSRRRLLPRHVPHDTVHAVLACTGTQKPHLCTRDDEQRSAAGILSVPASGVVCLHSRAVTVHQGLVCLAVFTSHLQPQGSTPSLHAQQRLGMCWSPPPRRCC